MPICPPTEIRSPSKHQHGNTRHKRLQTPEERRGITDAFLNIHYPCDSWTRVYTDGSAEDAVRNGGAGVCV